ncbi:MAG: DUF1501 domain-containing protein [Planctomycetaceae bacterium]|nr:DUF1501 domain-containing protein [Planctomycetaceae bacterium]
MSRFRDHFQLGVPSTRRQMLQQCATGFGWLALTEMLSRENRVHADEATQYAASVPAGPLSVKAPHFPAKAKRVIFLFMHGGPSHMDTFEYKPILQRDHGKPLPFDKPRVFSAQTGALMKSPFKFQQHGESGAWVSELFPEVAKHVDDLCIMNGMHGSNSRHGGALLELHTGSDTFTRPSMGSWLTYGLGTENQNLPGFITICPSLTHGGMNNWSSAFLPAVHQGTPIGNAGLQAKDSRIPYITGSNPDSLQRMELEYLQQLNQKRRNETGPDAGLEGRIEAFELAYKMQMEAPELQDISNESEETLKMYGLDDKVTEDFGRQCLMARRFSEQGVRFVQVSHSYRWDSHSNLLNDHTRNSKEVDKPISALLTDLKQRDLLKDTLVLWGGEFGRTPVSQSGNGRDHNPEGFTMWMAGGGIKPGIQYGRTDDYGYFAVENKIHFHDLHATMLHLLGLDHLKLTYRFGGRNFRLTDVAGEVKHDILA